MKRDTVRTLVWSGIVLLISAVILVASFSSPARAEPIRSYLCIAGCPDVFSTTLIVREHSITAYSTRNRVARWVAYKVTKETIGPTKERVWKADPLLSDYEQLEPEDYDGAYEALDTDRGHLRELASFTGVEGWEDTNYLTNITPQKMELNRGPWLQLESSVRALAQTYEVYVLVGTVLPVDDEIGGIGTLPNADEHTIIPVAYWKIAAWRTEDGFINYEAFLMEQRTPRSKPFCDTKVSLGLVLPDGAFAMADPKKIREGTLLCPVN